MAGDKIKLNVDLVKKYSNKLNTASENLGSVCTEMYNSITGIKDQSFKSQIAEAEYYNNIEDLNKKVPIFRDGVLKFSQFLLSQVIDTYGKGDEEIKEKLQNELDETIKQLATIGMIGGAAVDLTKISSTAQGALQAASSGEGWIESSKINKEAFTDTGNLEFVTRDDGSIMITRNGVPIGFTTEEGIIKNESTASETVPTAETNNTPATKYMSQEQYNTLSPAAQASVDREGYKIIPENAKFFSKSEYEKMGLDQRAAIDRDGYKVVSDLELAKIETARATGARSVSEIPKENNLASTEGMGNNEGIAKARENGTLPNTTPQYTESQKQYMDNQNSEIGNKVQNNENIQDSKWYTGIYKDVMSKRTDNQVTAINNETEKVLSGNGGLASEIIEKGSIPFPDNAILDKRGGNLTGKSPIGNLFKELRYNENTGKIDVIKKDGSTYDSYDVGDLTSAKWK